MKGLRGMKNSKIKFKCLFPEKITNLIYLQNKSVGKSIIIKKTRGSRGDSKFRKGYGKSGR